MVDQKFWYANTLGQDHLSPLLDSMVASFGVKFPRGMVWYRISIGIGIRIGIDGGSVVVCCMVLQEW